jgi:heat-inducible transcriptional repressor
VDDKTVAAGAELALSERQAEVLRVVVSSWIGQAAPVPSDAIAQLLPVACSSATVRSTLAELAELGLVTKRHASAGRCPTDEGVRLFVRRLLGPRRLGRDASSRPVSTRTPAAPPRLAPPLRAHAPARLRCARSPRWSSAT